MFGLWLCGCVARPLISSSQIHLYVSDGIHCWKPTLWRWSRIHRSSAALNASIISERFRFRILDRIEFRRLHRHMKGIQVLVNAFGVLHLRLKIHHRTAAEHAFRKFFETNRIEFLKNFKLLVFRMRSRSRSNLPQLHHHICCNNRIQHSKA